MSKCKHDNFAANVSVNRIEDIGSFSCDLTINCVDCGAPMVFLGLPRGVDPKGAAISHDGTEARLAIHPMGETVPEGGLGFMVRTEER